MAAAYENSGVVAEETYGSPELGLRKVYIRKAAGSSDRLTVLNLAGERASLASLRTFLTEVFLPLGFPDSVSGDYLEYQLWDSLQAFCSSMTGALSTHAILKGVGVGDDTATVMSATITWLLKDGTGMLGRILFTWTKGAELDCNCKKWRLFADLLNDTAIFMDLISPYFPAYFTPIVCTSGVFKAIVGVSGGATRASLTQHQARRNNMADVSAKDGSQETMVGLIALICSVLMIPIVTGKLVLTWTLFAVLTVLHIFCNYKAVTAVCMNSFNTERFKILLQNYLKHGDIMSVGHVNKSERVFFSLIPEPVDITLGVSLNSFLTSERSLRFYKDLFNESQYMLHVVKVGPKFIIQIALQRNCNPKTLLESMYQAILLESALTRNLPNQIEYLQLKYLCDSGNFSDESFNEMVVLSRKLTEEGFDNFYNRIVKSLWITSYVLFGAQEFRFTWKESQIF